MEQYVVAAKLFRSIHVLRIPSLVPTRNSPTFSYIITERRLATSPRLRSIDRIDTSTLSPTFKLGKMPLPLVAILSA
ncbi:Uncharacterized protein FWK35_00022344 [Aphis craccivora]|uniref:Uncharacterized protein n=1 Tax=Aphis craccivora TaxID=307492 RepID=A0A6G0Y2B0_APHCR|nr:Uncharacterized protein FWK35_00022344 [Aphis craccivora]